MTKRQRKAVFLVLKLAVAFGLLGWVVSQVHWQDYVVAKDANRGGKELAILEAGPDANAPQWFKVRIGKWWSSSEANRPADDFEVLLGPDKKQIGGPIRPGLRSTLETANLPLFGIVLAGYLFSLSVIGVRWWFLLRIQEIHISPWEAQKLTFLGQFYNTLVPSTVGGDVVKGYYIAQHTHRKAGALISIFVDRILGFAELALLAGVMLLIVWMGNLARVEQIRTAGLAVMFCLALVAGVLVFVLSPGFRRVFHLQKIYQRLPIAHHFAAAGEAANLYRHRIGGLVKAILMTAGAQVIWISSIGVLGKALGLPTPFPIYLVFVPVVYLCAVFIPTPGGVGPVEAFYCYFLATGGFCSASEAIALALLARLMDIARGLPGLWVILTGTKLPKAGAMEAELTMNDEEPKAESKPE